MSASVFSPVDVVFETVVRGVRDDATEANRKRKEALCHGGVPDSWLQEFRPFRSDKIKNSVGRSVQSDSADQQRYQYNVRKNGQEIRESPRALYTLKKHYADCRPASEKTKRQFPVRPPDPVVYVFLLVQNHSSANQFLFLYIYTGNQCFLSLHRGVHRLSHIVQLRFS